MYLFAWSRCVSWANYSTSLSKTCRENEGYKQQRSPSSRVVVAFEKPVSDVAVRFQRIPQRRHSLSRQVTSSFRYIERDCVIGDDNRMISRSCADRVEEQRNVTAFCPGVEYRSCLRVPITGSRENHAHHFITTHHNSHAIKSALIVAISLFDHSIDKH